MLDMYTYTFYKYFIPFSRFPNDTTFVSLAGGYNDFLVPAYLSNIRKNETVYAAVRIFNF